MTKFIAFTILVALCVLPVKAQTPPTPVPTAGPPNPQQLEQLIGALERGAVTANNNLNGGLVIICVGLIGTVLLVTWKRNDVADPALAHVIAKYDERMDGQQEIIESQRNNHERFLQLMEHLTSVQSSILDMLKVHDQNTNGEAQQISTIELALKTLVNQGSEPLREMMAILRSIDDRTKMMSETQLVNLQRIVQAFEDNLKTAVQDIDRTHQTILHQIAIRQTDSRPVVSVKPEDGS